MSSGFNFVPEQKQTTPKTRTKRGKKSSNNSVVIIVSAIAIVVVGLIVGFVVLRSSNQKSAPVAKTSFFGQGNSSVRKTGKERNIELASAYPKLIGTTREEARAKAKAFKENFESHGTYTEVYWHVYDYIHNDECPYYGAGPGSTYFRGHTIGICCPICGGVRVNAKELTEEEVREFVLQMEDRYREHLKSNEEAKKRREELQKKNEKAMKIKMKQEKEYQDWLQKTIEEEKKR